MPNGYWTGWYGGSGSEPDSDYDSGSNWDAKGDWDDSSSNTGSTHSDQSWSSS